MTTPADIGRTAISTALNLARMADRRAQQEGIKSYVASTGRFTPTARGGQVSLVALDQHSPVKREASKDASRRRKAPAHARIG